MLKDLLDEKNNQVLNDNNIDISKIKIQDSKIDLGKYRNVVYDLINNILKNKFFLEAKEDIKNRNLNKNNRIENGNSLILSKDFVSEDYKINIQAKDENDSILYLFCKPLSNINPMMNIKIEETKNNKEIEFKIGWSNTNNDSLNISTTISDEIIPIMMSGIMFEKENKTTSKFNMIIFNENNSKLIYKYNKDEVLEESEVINIKKDNLIYPKIIKYYSSGNIKSIEFYIEENFDLLHSNLEIEITDNIPVRIEFNEHNKVSLIDYTGITAIKDKEKIGVYSLPFSARYYFFLPSVYKFIWKDDEIIKTDTFYFFNNRKVELKNIIRSLYAKGIRTKEIKKLKLAFDYKKSLVDLIRREKGISIITKKELEINRIEQNIN